ncbi:hypothetical protein BDU57DRAFT_533038 [Ampelomyces quisqualis]|uniref:Uncharacterized protein n=1 Tax=Ampelomyces quisqualis TaxID=50730 RepID=A0A6A5Q9N4_AMPQU|nr:hypothetical protein BDU57DRAFT_533038 [Ampelomyces quisqualis]
MSCHSLSTTRTPSPPPPPANPANTPMPLPPATPRATTSASASSSSSASRKLPATPRSASLASPTPRTPGGTLRACSSDPDAMTLVKVHTAKCTECDKRNKDTMLRCPGCTFQICKPCRERRTKRGRGLTHGGMMSPGGLGSGLGSGGGFVRRRVLGSFGTTPPGVAVKKEEEDGDGDVLMEEKGKGKVVAKPAASKKRPAPKKSKTTVLDESSDDEFNPDPASATTNKRRRTTLTITDSPTATSARPSRTVPTSSAHLTYIPPSSPSTSSTSGAEVPASDGTHPSNLSSELTQKAWQLDGGNAAPTGRIQEMLEEHGVNTPENRYDEHLLQRYNPVMTNPIISIPAAVKRMADKTPRLSAEQKVDLRNKAHLALTVRDLINTKTSEYQSKELSADESDELVSAIKEAARKWAMRTWDTLPNGYQKTVARGLDMRLDHIEAAYKAQLLEVLEQCAARKLGEFTQDRLDQAKGAVEGCEGGI